MAFPDLTVAKLQCGGASHRLFDNNQSVGAFEMMSIGLVRYCVKFVLYEIHKVFNLNVQEIS